MPSFALVVESFYLLKSKTMVALMFALFGRVAMDLHFGAVFITCQNLLPAITQILGLCVTRFCQLDLDISSFDSTNEIRIGNCISRVSLSGLGFGMNFNQSR